MANFVIWARPPTKRRCLNAVFLGHLKTLRRPLRPALFPLSSLRRMSRKRARERSERIANEQNLKKNVSPGNSRLFFLHLSSSSLSSSFKRGIPGRQLELRPHFPGTHQPAQRRRGRAHGVAQAATGERRGRRCGVTRTAVVSAAGRELAEVLQHARTVRGAVRHSHGKMSIF